MYAAFVSLTRNWLLPAQVLASGLTRVSDMSKTGLFRGAHFLGFEVTGR